MLDRARRLLEEGRREEAVKLYEEFLKSHDDDLEAWLEFGLVCLLNNDRDRFLRVHAMFEHCMTPGVLAGLGKRARRLWDEYGRACSKYAAAAALGTIMMLPGGFAGCKGAATVPDVEAGPEVAAVEVAAEEPEQPAAQEPEADAAQDPDQGGDAAAEPAGDVKTTKKDKDKKKDGPPKYKTRYIAIHHLTDDDLGQ